MFPACTMSSATRSRGIPSLLAIASMIRRFAWCGTNAAMSAGVTPARRQASSATGAIAVVAHRNTACPSCRIDPVRP